MFIISAFDKLTVIVFCVLMCVKVYCINKQ